MIIILELSRPNLEEFYPKQSQKYLISTITQMSSFFKNELQKPNQVSAELEDKFDDNNFTNSAFGSINVTEDNTPLTARPETRTRKHCNEYSATNILERCKRHEIPLESN